MLRNVLQKFEDYLYAKNYSENTINDYLREMNRLNKWLEKNKNRPVYLDEVKEDTLEDYLRYLKERGCKASFRNRILYILRSFYNFVQKKELGDNIAIKLERIKTRSKERDYLEEYEIKKVIKQIDKSLIRYVTIFIYNTGCRISECLNMKIQDLDFENETVYIRKGKGNKDRRISMSNTLKQEMKDYLEIRPKVGNDKLFVTRRSGGLSSRHYNVELKKAVKKAGINKNITAHCIRHSTAVALVKKGADLPVVQRILGHENLETTSVYLHADLSDMKEAVDSI